MTHCRYFYTTRKGNHSAALVPTVVGGRRPLPSEICGQSDPPPFEKRRLWPISAHNVSTVGDSEKSSITTNIKSTTDFPTSHRWSTYITPKRPKGWLKERFFVFWVKVNDWSSQALSTQFAGQCHKHLMVGRNVYRTTVDGVEICIQQLGRVGLQPVWALHLIAEVPKMFPHTEDFFRTTYRFRDTGVQTSPLFLRSSARVRCI